MNWLTRSLMCVVLATSSCSSGPAPSGLAARQFTVESVGTVTMMVPTAWAESRPSFDQPTLLTVRYQEPTNKDFDMFFSVLPESASGENAIVEIGKRTVAAGEAWLNRTVEKTVDLRPIDGPALVGYYYVLTDSTVPLPPGEFKFITQGMGLVNNRVVAFTLFSNERKSAAVERGLSVVSSVTVTRAAQ